MVCLNAEGAQTNHIIIFDKPLDYRVASADYGLESIISTPFNEGIMTIRAIIFDLGGVLVRTADFSPRKRLGERFGMSAEALMDLVFGLEAGTRAQLGQVSVEQHWEHVRQVLGLAPQEVSEFQTAFWSEDFLDHELVETLRSLHGTYRTALLSNAFSDLRGVVTERLNFADVFDEMIISSEVGMVKPDPRIYHLTLERLGVLPQEAVFVDDMPHNVQAAQALGLHAIQYKNTPQVLVELEALLNGS
jgi:epoxide hydrolase-like predicted phosphatase